jgi:hypothetical protein
MPADLKEYFESMNWIVLVDSHRSRTKTMDNAFSIIDSEYIFYNEDDVLSKMPDILDISEIFATIIDDGRRCGMISLTLGGTQFDPNRTDDGHQFIGDLKYMNDNTMIKNSEYRIFKRMEEYANAWFFEFPGLFIKTDLFKKCHKVAKTMGGQIEQALTKAYINEGFVNKYYKCSIAKLNSLELLKINSMCVNHDCRLLTNLDSNQGNSSHGGNHNY